MRLIDLDQTIFVHIVDESKGGVEYEMEMTIGEMFDKFLDGFQPEIVSAIPVEWMCGLMDAFVTTGDTNMQEYALLLTNIIEAWQKEQKAR